ncbi:MAG: class I SAM-dependent methyltransferase [Omnitrophica bacterium]|nr:class I SAM-dependent methyltransferase [Candidatus Omnitrophota bacterium]
MVIDPFSIKKKYYRWYPLRVLFVAKSRFDDKWARLNFKRYNIPSKELIGLASPPEFDQRQTAVSPKLMQYLIAALKHTEHMGNAVVVEVGSYKGETTRCLAQSTNRKVIAVDPYFGYGATEETCKIFRNNVVDCNNVSHLKKTSGDAWRNWPFGSISFVFIDVLHDYANVSFDIDAWSQKLITGGLLALHDTANSGFAGSRRAAYYALRRFELWANPGNLVILQKSQRDA